MTLNMMKNFSVALFLFSGCAWDYLDAGEGFNPIAEYSTDSDAEVWAGQVRHAAEVWNERLSEAAALPCTPFLITPGEGMPVRLVPYDHWPNLDEQPGAVGWFMGDGQILVREDQSGVSRHITLLHEMGHAVGLPHSDDPESIMFGTTTGNITVQDILNMREAVGCGQSGDDKK